jgi:hypothetical protein
LSGRQAAISASSATEVFSAGQLSTHSLILQNLRD